MAKNDPSIPTYYLDAAVLIDLIEHDETEEPAKTMAMTYLAHQQS